MIETLFRSGFVRRRMADGHLGIILRDFATHLDERGHTLHTTQSYVQIAEHFSQWIRKQRIRASDIDEETLERFLSKHLPHCRCAKPAATHAKNCRAALNRLLGFLRQQQLVREKPPTRPAAFDTLLQQYESHLNEVGGLAESTIRYRRRYAREFLDDLFPNGRLVVDKMSRKNILSHVRRRARQLKPVSVRVLATSLRSFLRFLHIVDCCKPRVVDAVPQVAPWPKSSLPVTLSPQEQKMLLWSFDRTTAVGRRDFAIAVCLCHLGLRVCEVSMLSLDDLNWRRGTLHLRQTKQRRERLLPLPPIVAQALGCYLRRGRPQTLVRSLFVRHRAPLGEPLQSHHVRSAMRRAFARCGLDAVSPHVLRHTFAADLHRRGVGLKGIADLLGHQSLDTTARYARVDLHQLRQTALCWPERWI